MSMSNEDFLRQCAEAGAAVAGVLQSNYCSAVIAGVCSALLSKLIAEQPEADKAFEVFIECMTKAHIHLTSGKEA